MSYTNIFTGYNINPAFPSYATYTFADNISLTWASSFVDNTNVTAQINDLNATLPNLTVTLADATYISVGQTIQFNNVGANPVNILDSTGGLIATIPPTDNNQFVLYLRDNTTKAGTWGITHLGAGTSTADASALAGLGTIALNNQINTNFVGKQINGNYQVALTDRANILVSIGGALTVTLPPVASLPIGGGFFVAVNNQGSGTVTVTTSDATTIDGSPSFNINPGQSCYFINVLGADGLNWNSLGYGTPTFFQVQVESTNLTPYSGASVTLTSQQASPLVQNFTGALTGNVIVYFPAAAGQWYINNLTTGGFNVTVQLAGPTGNPILIPQGERVIIYSDGTTVYNTPTIATNAIFSDGSVGAPGITFSSDPSTGFYKLPNGVVGYSSLGTQSLLLGGATSGYGLAIQSGLTCRFYTATNSAYAEFKASNSTTISYIMTLPPSPPGGLSRMLYGNTGLNMHFSNANYPVSTTANQILYSSADNNITGLATANNGVLVTDNTGVPSLGSTLPLAVQGNITTLGTIVAGTWNGTRIGVGFGGTGIATTTPYSVLCGGTTSTGPFQQVAAGTIGQVLTYQGPSALPTWQNPSAGLLPATQAQQQAATSTTVYTSPGRQQYHPSAASAWVYFRGSDGSIYKSYGVSAVSFVGTGTYRITFSGAFFNTLYFGSGTAEGSQCATCVVDTAFSRSTTQIQMRVYDILSNPYSPASVSCVFFGQLA